MFLILLLVFLVCVQQTCLLLCMFIFDIEWKSYENVAQLQIHSFARIRAFARLFVSPACLFASVRDSYKSQLNTDNVYHTSKCTKNQTRYLALISSGICIAILWIGNNREYHLFHVLSIRSDGKNMQNAQYSRWKIFLAFYIAQKFKHNVVISR